MNGTPWLCRGARRRTARTVRAAPAATRESQTAASRAVEAPPRVARRDRDAPSPRAGATVGIGPPYRPARARPGFRPTAGWRRIALRPTRRAWGGAAVGGRRRPRHRKVLARME